MIRALILVSLVGAGTVACSGSTEKNDGGMAGAAQGGTAAGGGGATSHGGSVSNRGGTTSTSGGNASGGNASGGSGGAIGDVPLASFPGELAKVVCSRTFECCTPDELAQNPFGSNEQQCQGTVTGLLSLIIGPLAQSQAAGRADYNEAKVKGCLMGYSTTSCMDLRDPPATLKDMLGCDAFVTPKVALGKECTQSYECIRGYCDSAAGTCATLKANDADCFDDDECQSGNCPLDKCAPAAPEAGLCGN